LAVFAKIIGVAESAGRFRARVRLAHAARNERRDAHLDVELDLVVELASETFAIRWEAQRPPNPGGYPR
jgi:hypothetical protein